VNEIPRDVIEACEWLAEHRLDAEALRAMLPEVEDPHAAAFFARELERIDR
jgi:hypothetical protein